MSKFLYRLCIIIQGQKKAPAKRQKEKKKKALIFSLVASQYFQISKIIQSQQKAPLMGFTILDLDLIKVAN